MSTFPLFIPKEGAKKETTKRSPLLRLYQSVTGTKK